MSMLGNLSPMYQAMNGRLAGLRRRFAAGEITQIDFHASLYGLGYNPSEIRREIAENSPKGAQ